MYLCCKKCVRNEGKNAYLKEDHKRADAKISLFVIVFVTPQDANFSPFEENNKHKLQDTPLVIVGLVPAAKLSF